MTSPVARRRDRYGNTFYPVPDEHGEIHPLPSWTRLKNLLASSGVEIWKLKGVAREIAIREDLQLLASNDETLWEAVKQAQDSFRAKSNTGTAVHKFVELADVGMLDPDKMAPAAKPFIDQYERTVDTYGLVTVAAEVTVANLTAGYAGTADKFVEVTSEAGRQALADAGLNPDGVFTTDVKTGAAVWPETAIQLCAYSRGEFIWEPPGDTDLVEWANRQRQLEHDIKHGLNIPPTPTGKPRDKWNKAAEDQAWKELDEFYWEEFARYPGRRPMPDGMRTDVGLVLHLHADRCDVVPVRLDGNPSAFDIVCALAWVFKWKNRDDVIRPPLTTEVKSVPIGDHVGGDGVPARPDDRAVEPDSKASEGQPAEVSGQGGSDDHSGHDAGDKKSSGGSRARGSDPESVATAKQAVKRARLALEQPGTAENHAVAGEIRFAWLRARLQAIQHNEAGFSAVASAWPADTPTLKTFRHDDAALDRITAVLDNIEKQHGLPFGPSLRQFVSPNPEAEAAEMVTDTFPGSTPVASADDKQPYINWLKQLTERQPEAGPQIVADLERVGLRKSLSGAEWTAAELLQLATILRRAERATRTAPTTTATQ